MHTIVWFFVYTISIPVFLFFHFFFCFFACYYLFFFFFFFSSRRRHTRSKRDWSSDVCSSDLVRSTTAWRRSTPSTGASLDRAPLPLARQQHPALHLVLKDVGSALQRSIQEIGRASCRERV